MWTDGTFVGWLVARRHAAGDHFTVSGGRQSRCCSACKCAPALGLGTGLAGRQQRLQPAVERRGGTKVVVSRLASEAEATSLPRRVESKAEGFRALLHGDDDGTHGFGFGQRKQTTRARFVVLLSAAANARCPSLPGGVCFFLFATGVLSALLSLPSLWQFWRRWALAARCAGYGSSKSQMIRAYGRSTQAPTLRISIHMLTLFLASSEAGKLSGRGARGTLLSLLHLLPALLDPPSLPTTATSSNRVLA